MQKTNKLLIRVFGDGFFRSGIESILTKIPILIDLEVKLYLKCGENCIFLKELEKCPN